MLIILNEMTSCKVKVLLVPLGINTALCHSPQV